MTLAVVRFSLRARADLVEIDRYTLRKWGLAQADRYLNALQARCDRLAGNPFMGRACNEIQPGLRRIEHEEHVIFYRPHVGEIIVSRVLHRSMLAARHAMDEEL